MPGGVIIVVDEWKKIWNEKGALTKDDFVTNLKDTRDGFFYLKKQMGITTIGTEEEPSADGFISQFDDNYKKMVSLNSKEFIPKSFFDVGCGSGSYLFLLQRRYNASVVGGMDYSESLVNIARQAVLNPCELYADEAVNLRTDLKYDVVYSRSIFQYFPSEEYAYKVVKLMLKKANYSIAILDVYDIDKRDEFIQYRKSNTNDYDMKYSKTKHLFLSKKRFEEIADDDNCKVFFSNSELPGYWNSAFTYDVYIYINP